MEHYDGPAFFRRKDVRPVQKPKKENKTEEHKKTINEYSHREFHPSYIPPSVLNWGSSNLKRKYQVLVEEINKNENDYLLFDNNSENNDLETIDILQFKADQLTKHAQQNQLEKQQKQSEIESSELSNKTKQEKVRTDQNEDSKTKKLANQVEKNIDEQSDDSDILQEERLSTEKADQDIEYNEQNQNEMESDAAQKQSEIEVKLGNEVHSNPERVKEEQEDFDVSQMEDRPERIDINNQMQKDEKHSEDLNNSEPEHKIEDSLAAPKALNKSLTDIMQDESNEERNLKIFDESDQADYQVPALAMSEQYSGYQFPPLTLLPEPVTKNNEQTEEWALNQADILNETFKAFHVNAEVKDWTVGPTVTQFEVTLSLGVKVSKITNLADDLKLALAAKDIRIEAPIAGKSSVGIEIPNKFSRPVMLSEVLDSPQFKNAESPLTVALGVDLFGVPQITNIHDMPHGLIAGATGSGKSVFINSLLISLLYKATPQQVKLLLIDPKTVELAPYAGLPHLLAPVISDPQAATASLKWAVDEMNQRYEKLAAAGVRDIDSFNRKVKETGEFGLHMPYIVIIIDELADLMMTASAEISDYIGQITAKARACGIHLLVATQRPSVDVITGTMKNNIPTRIAFMVSSQVDSRTIIDSAGAEKLLGKGDMLYLGNGKSQPKRLQGTYINDDKIDEIVDFVKHQGKPQYAFDPDNLKKKELSHENEDEILPRVLDYIVNEETTSTSKLQRVFSIGYNRAARIIEQLEKKQYISPAHGSKPRKVFLTQEELDKIRGE